MPTTTPGSDAGVTQTSGQKTRIPGLGGAVSDMHLGGRLLPTTRRGLGGVAYMAAEWADPGYGMVARSWVS